MSRDDKPAPARAAKHAAARSRHEARLAAALRANLGRRKAQAREREDAADPPPRPPRESS
jgi:hypothetical protein